MSIRKLFDYSVPLVAASTILVIGVFATALYVGNVLYTIKLANDTIEVTGSAKQAVVADTARWVINLEARTGVNNQQTGFNTLEAAVQKISTYLNEQGLTEYETPSGSSYPQYTYPQNAEPYMTGYSVTRSIIVRSTDIEKLSALANNMTPLSGAGYTVTTGMLELTYSKLAELRVSLLSEAIKDAEDRARAITEETGRSVRALRNATSGVVQVLSAGAVEISDYGAYDTQSMNKEVMVTVRATFSME